MKSPLRTKIRAAIRSVTGYDVHKAALTREPFSDIRRLIDAQGPIVFDVGANTGQTIDKLSSCLPSSHIHAFEPTKSVFNELKAKWQNRSNVHLNNVAVGSKIGRRRFFENSHSVMNSFLPLGADGWGDIISMPEIELTTIDRYCAERGIAKIDLLKSDTQGFEMEVINGAKSMIRNTHLVYMEMNFARLYEKMATFDELYRAMTDNNFGLVALYEFNYKNDRLGWVDALFINERRSPQ
jgi:FkbM family methyltransferase